MKTRADNDNLIFHKKTTIRVKIDGEIAKIL